MPSRVFIANGEAQLEVEGEEEFIEKKLAKLLPLVIGAESGRAGATRKKEEKEAKEDKDEGGPAPHTLKGYIKMKAPANVYEAIALVLDFGRKYQEKAELSGDEIRRRLIQGGYRPAQSMTQALADARRKYGYVEVGSKKGLWKLSAEGETVVELDLPRSKKSE